MWVSASRVRRIEFGAPGRDARADPPDAWPPFLKRVVDELAEYFDGRRSSFDLPVDLEGTTEFQRSVYGELAKIPHGQVVSYGDVASALGRPDQARAVGQAVGANPLPIVIPCHRVVSSDGRLVGFGGGLPAKAALLQIEGVQVDGHRPSSRVHPEILRLDLP